MPKAMINSAGYAKLLSSIRREIARGLKAAQQEVDYQRIITYRNIGCFIAQDALKGKLRPEYGSALYKHLSDDLGMPKEALSQMARVYRAFPDEPKKDGLNWSHYVILTRVKDPQRRLNLKKRILKEHLTNPDLRLIVKDLRRPEDFVVSRGKLQCQRGKLYHYSTRQASDLHSDRYKVEIDCGFEISIDKPENAPARLSRGKIVLSKKNKKGYKLTQPKPQPLRELLYTYQAYVKRVIDADTLVVKVDRLRHIHSPASAPAGN